MRPNDPTRQGTRAQRPNLERTVCPELKINGNGDAKGKRVRVPRVLDAFGD
jgi:hypothetical protein